MLLDERLVRAWLAQWDSELLAARCTAEPDLGVVTEAFAALNLDSERAGLLLATFVADQLSTRPPITAAEIEALKRRLGIDTGDT